MTAGTTYYVRAYAVNSQGITYGSQETFTTTLVLIPPTITTTPASTITTTGATLGGNVTSDGNATITERGVVYATTLTPTISNTKVAVGTGTGSFTTNITGLLAGTTYYFRAYAVNSQGIAYGSQETLTTTPDAIGTVSDIDGNIYHYVTIGTQVWMVENLKTTKYRNGDPIVNITDNAVWSTLTSGAYCWYNNDAATYKTTYGALYNWYVITDSRNIAPVGWHIPTRDELGVLQAYIPYNAGAALKESGTTHWVNPGGTNTTGFTALPGGERNTGGTFEYIGYYGNWWTSTAYSNKYARYYGVTVDNSVLTAAEYVEWTYGYSARCIKD